MAQNVNVDQSSVNEDMTVDQIAQDAGIPVSTVRLYQNKGLLSPPERRGRVGYYNEQHRDRLKLIAHLQDRGFSLAAIKEALTSWNAGRSLNHLLGVGDVAPSLEREALRLSPAELAERFEGVAMTQSDMQRAADMGLIEVDGSEIVVPNGTFVEIGAAVVKFGVPVGDVLDEYEAMREAVAGIAERFRSVFEERLWAPFVDQGMPADLVPALTTDVGQLAELATSVVTTELHDRFAEFAADFMARAENERS